MSPNDGSPSAKRRRVPLACSACRERKVRCDGARPVCGACARRGVAEEPCEYMVIADTAKFQTEREYVRSLRNHIAYLESSIAQPLAGPSPQLQPPSGITPPASRREHCEHHPTPQSPSQPSSVSAMGAAVAEIREADVRDQYYGQTSLVSLVREYAHTPKRQTRPVSTPCNMSSGGPCHSFLSDDFSLPPRKTADWLVDIYFATSHLFYPWIHKDSFMTSYTFIWSNQEERSLDTLPDVGLGGRNCPPAMFYCALNAIFAIACEFSNMPPQEKRSTSLMFYERMKGLINIDIFDSGSLAHVQALLLVGLYLQCTAFPERCWNIVGMAYRMSIGLGLQLCRRSGDLSRLERELRWRAWCACVHMDIMVSMTMGRPPMTSIPFKVPLPSPIDDKYLAVDRLEQPADEVSGNQFLYENTRIIGILGTILANIYHTTAPGPEVGTPPRDNVNLQAILEIDRALEEFEATVHPALQWTGARDMSNEHIVSRRLSNVLHARFLHLRLLLYRPAFSVYCSSLSTRQNTDGPRRWSTICRENCAANCVQAACDLVESIFTSTTQDATGAWWYRVFYLISSGFILLLANSSNVSFEGLDKGTRERAWDQCIQTLNIMANLDSSARDYAMALSGLKKAQENPPRPPDTQSPEIGVAWDQNGPDPNGLYNAFDSLVANWDNGIEDIMLPAQFLQEMDDGLLLPTLL
ncbi:fungal-specific transcription factor domain-containing protein [Aspergillus unguis]